MRWNRATLSLRNGATTHWPDFAQVLCCDGVSVRWSGVEWVQDVLDGLRQWRRLNLHRYLEEPRFAHIIPDSVRRIISFAGKDQATVVDVPIWKHYNHVFAWRLRNVFAFSL